jgi:glycosyltransferase involved in cell wall biosynthesis
LHTKRRLVDWGFPADQTLIHRVGVDTNYYRFHGPGAQHEGPVRMLMIGNLVPVKGHEYALRAVSEVRRMAPSLDLKLRLVGEGSERERLDSLRDELSLHDTVDIVGPLGRDSIRSELQAADLFLLPSLAEMTPVVLMEAQSVGLPVIATRVGAVDEVVREGGSALLVPPGDPDALARSIVDLARAPQQWPTMARIGRRHVEEFFDIHALVSELEEIYRSLGSR